MTSTAGFAKKADRYDNHNAVIEESLFGVDGQPV